MKRRVADDLAALQLRQREALNDVTAAAAAPSAYKPVRGEETRATRPLSNQVFATSIPILCFTRSYFQPHLEIATVIC